MRTKLDVDRGTYFDTNFRKGFYTRFLLILGGIVASAERGRALWDIYNRRMSARQAGALTTAQVNSLILSQEEVGDPAVRLSYIKMTEEVLNAPDRAPLHPHQRGARLLLRLLSEHQDSIRSVANVGARVDIASSLCAERFPTIQFTSIDFQPDVADHNVCLGHKPNWHYKSGYALDLWKRGECTADVVFMTSTACLFNNKELNEYIEVMKPTTKFFVLSEQWFPRPVALNPFSVIRPEQIGIEYPVLAGWEGIYLHNYVGKFERAGYTITHSKIMPTVPGRYCYEMIAMR